MREKTFPLARGRSEGKRTKARGPISLLRTPAFFLFDLVKKTLGIFLAACLQVNEICWRENHARKTFLAIACVAGAWC